MRLSISVFLLLLLNVPLQAQEPVQVENPYPYEYRSTENPWYWKNNPPDAAYWQQDVHYRIKADVDVGANVIRGKEWLTYYNNSPDTLTHVFFHLYQNAFQPGSYYDKLHAANRIKPQYGPYEREGLGTAVRRVMVNGQDVPVEIDNTLMRVPLPEPVLPGESTEFQVNFWTFFDVGSVRRRMKVFMAEGGHKHFDAVHWYPRISVYDRKFGWTTDQHLGREFYGDYGTFEVELTLPQHFIADGTGYLVNRDEMLPPELMEKIQISNFKDKPLGSTPSQPIEPDTSIKKTWEFYAVNVHDFGWTADPTYRIGIAEWNGVKAIALAREANAARWQGAADYAARIIETFSRDFGMYVWPKIIVADARDGMEYPMMTLDGGYEPHHHGLLVHEVGHMWFFGMLGNNETWRASMDEGFTQFLTVWGLERLDGPYPKYSRPKYASDKYTAPEFRMSRLYVPYLMDAIRGQDAVLNTHSDDFGGALRHGGGYGHVYYKMGTMLYNLQYVLGEELFQSAMRNYVEQWKIAHPYFEDFRSSIINYTNVDLNWFFDQWWSTNKHIDYAIETVNRNRSEGTYNIVFRRKGESQMPIEFTVYTADGEEHDYLIPNTWFVKETDATVLPRWIGWGEEFNDTYIATIELDERVRRVEIDPEHRMADVNLLDNSTAPQLKFQFEQPFYDLPEWEKYVVNWRPELWYNAIDGVKPGLHFNGNYMNYLGRFRLTLWGNTGLGQWEEVPDEFEDPILNYNFSYRTGVPYLHRNLHFDLESRLLDGLWMHQVGLDWEIDEQKTVGVRFKSMLRPDQGDLSYLLYPEQWEADQYNNTLNLEYTQDYRYPNGRGEISTTLRTSAFTPSYNWSMLEAEAENANRLGRFILNTRVYGAVSGGSDIPEESKLYLAGGSPEEMMDNKFVRSRGFVPPDWLGYGITTNHFQYGGGLNLRGYAGYVVPHQEDGQGGYDFLYSGHTGAAVNAELEFDNYFRIRPPWVRNWLRMDTYLFGDVGVINSSELNNDLEFGDIRGDAGIGAAATIHNWFNIEKASPLTLRVDFPLYLSHVPAAEEGNFDFRWIVGIGRAF